MNTERDCTEVRENVSTTSATSDVAAQAWDKAQWKGSAYCRADKDQTHIDLGNNDIYNTNRGNNELGTGNRALQCAENDINRTINQMMDGGYDRDKLLKQLDASSNHLDDATGEYRGAIRHLGASSSSRELEDMLDGRRDVMSANQDVSKAMDQLKAGDEAGALKSLLKSLGKIDGAQSEISDLSSLKTLAQNEPGCDHNQAQNQDNGHERFHPHFPFRGPRPFMNDNENVNDWRNYTGGSGALDQSGRRHDHMYRGFNPLDPLGIADNLFPGLSQSNGNMWGSSDLNPPGLLLPNIDQLNSAGDQIARVVDPAHILPTPSELSDPGKAIKHVLDPLGIFG